MPIFSKLSINSQLEFGYNIGEIKNKSIQAFQFEIMAGIAYNLPYRQEQLNNVLKHR